MPICKARSSRTGFPCKKQAISGGTVCRNHGGGAPQVRERARLRLLELVDPALAALARSVSKKASEAIQLKAATEILDRANIGAENQAVMGHREFTVRFVDAKPAEDEE